MTEEYSGKKSKEGRKPENQETRKTEKGVYRKKQVVGCEICKT